MIQINRHERKYLTSRGSNPRPPDHQSDAYSTEPYKQERPDCNRPTVWPGSFLFIIQLNRNGTNVLGTMKICFRNGLFKPLIALGFNDTSILVEERENRDSSDSRRDEREGKGRKRNMNEREETEGCSSQRGLIIAPCQEVNGDNLGIFFFFFFFRSPTQLWYVECTH